MNMISTASPKNLNTSTFKRKNRDTRRQEILNVAIDIFYEYGYQKASIRDISKRMGFTKAAVYYYFQNKEEILYTIVDQISNQVIFALKSQLSTNKEPVEKLRDIILSQISFIKSHRKGVKIVVEDKRFLSGDLNRLVKEKEKTIFHLYRTNMEDLQRKGKLRELDLTTATFAIFGMINWLYHWYRPEGRLSIEQLAEHIVNILLYGLLDGSIKERKGR